MFMTQMLPYSRRALGTLDGRSKEARLMRDTRDELTAHVGGSPSPTQKALIDTAVQLRLRIAVMDRAFSKTQTQTEHDNRTYLAHANSYARVMKLLGRRLPQQSN